MGMLMVAEGLGLTVLPDYSVVGDPLRRAGLITHRPITGDATAVSLILLQRQLDHAPQPVRDLREAIVRHAVRYADSRVGPSAGGTSLVTVGAREDTEGAHG